jgi:hypothetical protein
VTTVREEAREGSSLAVSPEINAEAGAHARASVTLPSALPSAASVTARVRQAGELVSRAGALLDKPGTLVHAQPPTFRQAHDRHRECAAYFQLPVLRFARRAWGWFHLLVIKPALNGLEWVTESPLRAVIALAIAAVIWLWS